MQVPVAGSEAYRDRMVYWPSVHRPNEPGASFGFGARCLVVVLGWMGDRRGRIGAIGAIVLGDVIVSICLYYGWKLSRRLTGDFDVRVVGFGIVSDDAP